jgi:tetratricopeptide (TPR) repeat protein
LLRKIGISTKIALICAAISTNSGGSAAPGENENIFLNKIEQEYNSKTLSKASLVELIFIVNKYPKNGRAHIILGNCCDSMGLPEQAMEQYKLAFKYSPNNVGSLIELVKAQVRAGQLSAASSLLKQAMQRFPADPQILFWTGNALFKEHRYDEAKQLYAEALNNSKSHIVGINSALGHLSLLQEQYANALALAMADISYEPNHPQANEVAGLALLKMGKFEHAISHLAIAYKNCPSNYDLALSYARALIWCGKYNSALMPGLSALASAPNFIDRYAATKTLEAIAPYLSKVTILEVIDEVNNSRTINKNIFVHLELAKICLKKNLSALAYNESLTAVKIDPWSAQAKFRLALITESYKQDYKSALNLLREAKVLDPYNYEIKQYLMHLEDRLTIKKTDWAWSLKDWLDETLHQTPEILN